MRKQKSKTKTNTKKINKDPKPYELESFTKAAVVASYFGFIPVKTPSINKDDIEKAESLKFEEDHDKERDFLYPTPEEKAAVFRMYSEEEMSKLPHPIMLYMDRPFSGGKHRKSPRKLECELEILGSEDPIAEGLAIRSTLSILEEEGYSDLMIEINTIGDKESAACYEKELVAHVRKHINRMPADLRQAVKKEPFAVLKTNENKHQEFKESAPTPLSCLNDESSAHFKEVLEYVESMDVPYKITSSLAGSKKFYSHTMFEIKDSNDGTVLAVGSRHNNLARKLGGKKDMQILDVNISCKQKTSRKLKTIPKTNLFFVQLGFLARIESLKILEKLRKAGIRVNHSLFKEKISPQLQLGGRYDADYMVIIGMKEAVEGTAIVRDMTTRSQVSIDEKDLITHLKKLK